MALGEGKVCRREERGSCWGREVFSNSYLGFKVRLEREIRASLSHFGSLDFIPQKQGASDMNGRYFRKILDRCSQDRLAGRMRQVTWKPDRRPDCRNPGVQPGSRDLQLPQKGRKEGICRGGGSYAELLGAGVTANVSGRFPRAHQIAKHFACI